MLYYRSNEFELKSFRDWFRNKKRYIRNSSIPPLDINPPEKKISICTTCMNRLHDIKQTLPKNLEDNAGYENAEFVLLDYNSSDGLPEWVQENMMSHIRSGRLSYYRTEEPKNFCPNHSRNVSFHLAKGNLVANVDSDNFVHPGYLKRLNQCASLNDDHILILPENFLIPGGKRLYLKGRFALYKKDIELLRGFDEDLDDGFGNDDVNFIFRAMLCQFPIARFESHYSDDRLPTTNEERVQHVKNKNFHKMQDRNARITYDKLSRGVVSVNKSRAWGRCKLIKNFEQEVVT